MAAEFAQEEANHIAWIQGNLGEAAIPMPQVRRACIFHLGPVPQLCCVSVLTAAHPIDPNPDPTCRLDLALTGSLYPAPEPDPDPELPPVRS